MCTLYLQFISVIYRLLCYNFLQIYYDEYNELSNAKKGRK